MSSLVVSLFWLLLFVGGGIFLAYQRIDLRTSTIATGIALLAYTIFGDGAILWKLLLWALFGAMIVPNLMSRTGKAKTALREQSKSWRCSELRALLSHTDPAEAEGPLKHCLGWIGESAKKGAKVGCICAVGVVSFRKQPDHAVFAARDDQ